MLAGSIYVHYKSKNMEVAILGFHICTEFLGNIQKSPA